MGSFSGVPTSQVLGVGQRLLTLILAIIIPRHRYLRYMDLIYKIALQILECLVHSAFYIRVISCQFDIKSDSLIHFCWLGQTYLVPSTEHAQS
jgi:hypothetical protein